MTDANINYSRPYKPFGFNVKVPDANTQTLKNTSVVSPSAEPLFKFLEENEEVFTGDIAYKINQFFAENFRIGTAMRNEDEAINGQPSSFDMHF